MASFIKSNAVTESVLLRVAVEHLLADPSQAIELCLQERAKNVSMRTLHFIANYSAQNGYPPLLSEISQSIGITHPLPILKRLHRAGLITKNQNKRRVYEITSLGATLLAERGKMAQDEMQLRAKEQAQ